jgi:ADP-ribosyl-[dinitrogen reductase] hydrolase
MKTKDLLFGVAIGDALGVPVEFRSRNDLEKDPVREMRSYGSHFQPAGTWSDDSSLTFCLADALTERYNIRKIADKCAQWYFNNLWTAHGNVFDIGNSTRIALGNIKSGIAPHEAGGKDESSNGNGSLMRISPLVFYLIEKSVQERFEITAEVSSITHGHIRSILACFYYLEFCSLLAQGTKPKAAYTEINATLPDFLSKLKIPEQELNLFNRLLDNSMLTLSQDHIESTGYVIHTLEASIWCILHTDNFTDAVLKAVNLGSDTDTTGAVTGAMAGLIYGYDSIPDEWISVIAKKKEIEQLAEKLHFRLCQS